MRYLAIDLGDKRTGLAAGDDQTGLVSPVAAIEIRRGHALIDAVLKQIHEQEPDAIVIGLPLNMDGTEGDRARIARAFGETLAQRCPLPIHYQDERLTSFAADERMAGTGRTHQQKKELRDALAAAEILRDFFDGQR